MITYLCNNNDNLLVVGFKYYITTYHSSITTYLTHYGSYRTVEPFDPPTQNTINSTYEHPDKGTAVENIKVDYLIVSYFFLHY